MPQSSTVIRPRSVSGQSFLAVLAAVVFVGSVSADPKSDDAPKIGRRVPAPRTERVVVGTTDLPEKLPSVLVNKPQAPADAPFKRLPARADIHSTDTLVSLPGYSARVVTRTGVALTLRGNLPEFSVNPLMDGLLEAAVVLHAPPDKIDLDLTLDRGRVYLTNLKDGKVATVRLRFLDEAWDLTLADGTEIGVDLIKRYAGGANYLKDEPWTSVALFVLQGKAELSQRTATKQKLAEPPGVALVQWDSEADAPPSATPVAETPPIWSRQSPLTALGKQIAYLNALKDKSKPEQAARIQFEIDFYTAQARRTKETLGTLTEFGAALAATKPVEAVLGGQRSGKEPGRRHVALFALAAIGDLKKVLNALNDDDPERRDDRDDAVFVLRRFACRGLDSSRLLYDEEGKKPSGALVEAYGAKDGERVFTLLHDFDLKNLTPDTYELLAAYLRSDKLALRQLAHWHLLRLSVGVKLPPEAANYNPADPSKKHRDEAAAQWAKLVADKKLPPVRQ